MARLMNSGLAPKLWTHLNKHDNVQGGVSWHNARRYTKQFKEEALRLASQEGSEPFPGSPGSGPECQHAQAVEERC